MDEIEEAPSAASIRRTFTLRNNAARQVAVNFMPSRQLPYNTIRLRRNNSEHNALLEELERVDGAETADQQADIIVREMELHQHLMEDNPGAEELRREALRDLPQGLTMKRHVRAKLSASVSLRSKRRPLSLYKRMKYRISFAWKRALLNFRSLASSVELWYEAIRNIEGHFGSAVGSYFYFLRWLFVMNLVLSVFVVSFIVTPQILHDGSGSNISRGFLDFVSGEGTFEDSLLFYGHYHDGDISTSGPFVYDMPFAYFFTMSTLFVMFFGILCYRTAYLYRGNFIQVGGGVTGVFAHKVFSGWDFGIATSHAARLCANSIYNEFKELLSEMNKKHEEVTLCTKICQYVANITITLIVLSLIAGAEFGFWQLLCWQNNIMYWQIYVSLIITGVVTVFPILFTQIVYLERYKPRTALYVTLARTWLLDAGTLTLLLYYWANSEHVCWETRFGQAAYRLVLLDSIISLFVLPVIEFVRGWLFKLKKLEQAPEFNIAYNSLTLIYNQVVLWYGMVFSPLLVVAVTIKFLVLFYVKRECALRACHPARKVWRAAQTQTVLFMLVTLSLFTSLLSIGSLFLRMSSHGCGPFKNYEVVYAVVTEGVLALSQHHTIRNVLSFFTKPGVIAFLILFLCVGVYYARARGRAQRSMARLLRDMLRLQARDKDFLLAAIGKVSNGEWLYNPKMNEPQSPNSHTWKYLKEVRKPSNAEFNFEASRLSHSMHERPRSYAKENRPSSYYERRKSIEDGDTDSSFSWQGSSSCLNQINGTDKKWI